VTVKTIYLPRDFCIPLDEALFADPSPILQAKVYSPVGINFGSAFATQFGVHEAIMAPCL
jgi:hypothetical protein